MASEYSVSEDLLLRWLILIGTPPEWAEVVANNGQERADQRYRNLCWIEDQMQRHGIIRYISDQYYSVRAVDYMEYLIAESKRKRGKYDGKHRST